MAEPRTYVRLTVDASLGRAGQGLALAGDAPDGVEEVEDVAVPVGNWVGEGVAEVVVRRDALGLAVPGFVDVALVLGAAVSLRLGCGVLTSVGEGVVAGTTVGGGGRTRR
ncbi:MAG: hypothetical protein ACXV3C_07880 [Actinomycetes bacterium]